MSRIFRSSLVLLFCVTIFAAAGCGNQQGANVAEPEIIAPGAGIPNPEDGMPGAMGDQGKAAAQKKDAP